MLFAELTFRETIVIELLKALFTAVLVAGAAAFFVSRYQTRAETKRADADNLRAEATKRRESELQVEQTKRAATTDFIHRTSELAGSFYYRTQRFWRQREDSTVWGDPQPAAFDADYVNWATTAEGLESELHARYGFGSRPPQLWHQVRDLLTVRYFDLRGRNSEALRKNNAQTADATHSGLTVEQLADANVVLATYREAMKELAKQLHECPITV